MENNTGTETGSPRRHSAEKSPVQWIVIIFAVALGYFVTAKFSLLLAAVPSEASPVWPPAGIAAGALILYGRRAAFGVFLGALATYLASWLETDSSHQLLRSLLLIVLLSTSATLQALVIRWLVMTFSSRGLEVVNEKFSLKFIFLLAPLGCLTAAVLSNTVFLLFGINTPDSFLYSGFSWWIGDTIGVVTMVPLMFAMAGPGANTNGRQIPVSIAMLCVLSIVFAFFFYNKDRDIQQINDNFSGRVDYLQLELQSRFDGSLDVVYALKYFLESKDDISETEFNEFASGLLARNIHLQALEWIPRVSRNERAAFESREDGPGVIRILGADQRVGVAPPADEYFPVQYLVPVKGNERALGFDVSSNPLARRAQEMAREQDQPAASQPIRLVQETGVQSGTVVYMPVEKEGEFAGFAAVVIRVEAFISHIIANAPGNTGGLRIRIFDPALAPPLYTRGDAPQAPNSNVPPLTRELQFANRLWTMRVLPGREFTGAGLSGVSLSLLMGGMLSVAILGSWILAIANRARQVAVEVDLRTGELKREVAEKERAQAELRKLSQAIEYNPSMVMITDTDGRIEYVNPMFTRMTGYSPDELAGASANRLYSEVYGEHYFSGLIDSAAGNHGWQGEIRCVRKDGQQFWAQTSIASINDGDGELKGFVVLQQDVTREKHIQDKINYQARHDLLTGLVNRYEFERELQRLVENIQQTNAQHAFCYCDLDQFKIVNDTSGHEAGDALLERVARLLRESFRRKDIVARLGGDEFGILMENCTLAEARSTAEKVREKIEALRFTWGESIHYIGVSIGIVPVDSNHRDYTEVLKSADSACYAAKDAGRNQIHVYSPGDQTVARRRVEIAWLNEINTALESDSFELFGQLIVPMSSDNGRRPHVEVLIRMRQDGQLISPAMFLPAAERYGLATKIDQWVVTSVFDWLQRNPRLADDIGALSINLSGHSLGNHKLLDGICEQLSLRQVDGRLIHFEITETAVISNFAEAHRFIDRVKALGGEFCLDDFGSGLSSFAYLKTLPVGYLKIDGQFIREMADDNVTFAMVKSINEVGQLMGKKTVAEFVENERIIRLVEKLGIDYAQGFAISHPKPLADAVREAGEWRYAAV